MRVQNVRYQLTKDGQQILTAILSGNCEEECRRIEEKCDKGGEVYMNFSSGKRNLNQNALYWVLIGRMARALNTSMNEVHNTMLRRYGVPYTFDGQVVYAFLPDTEESERRTLMEETNHLKPTSNIKEGKGDVNYRAYILLKGSSQMDTEEMSHLIDGAKSECKEMGLPSEAWGV